MQLIHKFILLVSELNSNFFLQLLQLNSDILIICELVNSSKWILFVLCLLSQPYKFILKFLKLILQFSEHFGQIIWLALTKFRFSSLFSVFSDILIEINFLILSELLIVCEKVELKSIFSNNTQLY